MKPSFPGDTPLLISGGALGSTLLCQLEQMGWRNWVLPPRKTVLRAIASLTCPGDTHPAVDGLRNADFILDASASLSVPRGLARMDVARCASIFLTPSGASSVILLEDVHRSLRLDQLEAQYYRWIITHAAGSAHLDGPVGGVRYDGGHPDLPGRGEPNRVETHSRLQCQRLLSMGGWDNAVACIWWCDPGGGSIFTHGIRLYDAHEQQINSWRLVWDEGAVAAAMALCENAPAHEPRGILLGYVDRSSHSIFLVDVCGVPREDGLHYGKEIETHARHRTRGIVHYIGDFYCRPGDRFWNIAAAGLRGADRPWVRRGGGASPGLILVAGVRSFGFFVQDNGTKEFAQK